VKILVTGGTGFLGRALCRRLATAGHDVVSLGSRAADLRSENALDPFRRETFDQVYHLAAWTQAGEFCLHHQGEQWLINQQINTNVLAWWQAYQPHAKLICIGSSCAYDPSLPLVESNYMAGTPIDSLFSYAMTKRMLYAGIRALNQQFGLRYLCVVPSTLYGPDYPLDDRQPHFIVDIIRKILQSSIDGTSVVLWGDGTQRRELVYLDDFVTGLVALADRVDNELVNAGAGEDHSIRELARMVCSHAAYDSSRVQFDETRYVGARAKLLDVSRLRTLLPDLRFTPLDTGLATTINWFRAHDRPPASVSTHVS